MATRTFDLATVHVQVPLTLQTTTNKLVIVRSDTLPVYPLTFAVARSSKSSVLWKVKFDA